VTRRAEFYALIGAFTLLFCLSTAKQLLAGSLRGKAAAESVHYDRRYGWRCGMQNYGHEYRKICWRIKESGRWSDNEGKGSWSWQRRSFGAGGRPVEN
jgi:hypothetical protein